MGSEHMNKKSTSIEVEFDKSMKAIGKSPSYFVKTLFEGCVYLITCEQKVLEQELGSEKCEELIEKIMSLWAVEQGKSYKEQFLKQGVPADARLLGKMYRKWFEDNWLVTYEVVEDTPDRHEGKITRCMDEIFAKRLFGEKQQLFDYDHIYASSQIEVNSMCKAAGLEKEFNCSHTGFICTGGCCDTIVFERKKR